MQITWQSDRWSAKERCWKYKNDAAIDEIYVHLHEIARFEIHFSTLSYVRIESRLAKSGKENVAFPCKLSALLKSAARVSLAPHAFFDKSRAIHYRLESLGLNYWRRQPFNTCFEYKIFEFEHITEIKNLHSHIAFLACCTFDHNVTNGQRQSRRS